MKANSQKQRCLALRYLIDLCARLVRNRGIAKLSLEEDLV